MSIDEQIARAFREHGWETSMVLPESCSASLCGEGGATLASAWWDRVPAGAAWCWIRVRCNRSGDGGVVQCVTNYVKYGVGDAVRLAAELANQPTQMVATRDVEAGELVTTKDVVPVGFGYASKSAAQTAAEAKRVVEKTARIDAPPPSRHNTTCPRCNGPAYQGLGAVRCEREGGCLADAEPSMVRRLPLGYGREREEYYYNAEDVTHGGSAHAPTRDLAVAAWRKAVLDRAWGRR